MSPSSTRSRIPSCIGAGVVALTHRGRGAQILPSRTALFASLASVASYPARLVLVDVLVLRVYLDIPPILEWLHRGDIDILAMSRSIIKLSAAPSPFPVLAMHLQQCLVHTDAETSDHWPCNTKVSRLCLSKYVLGSLLVSSLVV